MRNRASYSTTVERLFLPSLSVFLNLMLSLADRDASAVVEDDQAGQLRFRYTRFQYITNKLFRPYGIINYR